MATTIVTKYGSGAPTASDLVEGELAVDTTNGRLYTENSSAAVVELGSNPSGNITFGDNGKAIFGAGSDLQIYHNGSTSVIEDSGTGNLQIRTSTLAVVNAAGTEVIMQGVEDGAVSLYHNAGVKLATTATGIDVTGTVVSDGLTVDGNNDIQINRDGVSSAKVFWNRGVTQDAAIELDASESLTISVDDAGLAGKSLVLKNNSKVGFALADGGDISFYEDTGTTAKLEWLASAETLKFADNGKAVFGAGSDLQIYHDGSASRIVDTGPGDLYIQATDQLRLTNSTASESYLIANENSGVSLYFDNSPKLATTSTGIDVSGTVVADDEIKVVASSGFGRLEVGGPSGAFVDLKAPDSDDYDLRIKTTGTGGEIDSIASDFRVKAANVLLLTSNTERMRVTSGGKVGIGTDSGVNADLHLHKTSGPKLWITSNGNNPSDAGSLRFSEEKNGNNYFEFKHDGSTNKLKLTTTQGDLATFERVSRNVGIGTDAPSHRLVSSTTTSYGQLRLQTNDTDDSIQYMGMSFRQFDKDANGYAGILGFANATENRIAIGGSTGLLNAATTLQFFTAANNTTAPGTEAMRITSGRHVLVGKTNQDSTNTVGFEAKDDGLIVATTDGSQSLILNRKTSPGTIAEFRQNNTTVGSIGTNSGSLYIGSGDTGLNFRGDLDSIYPWGPTGGARPGFIDLGYSTVPFKNLFLSEGVYLGGAAAANKLDSYEEGTWDPTLTDGTTTVTQTNKLGSYVKVGNIVSVYFQITNVSVSGLSGTVKVGGLPFTTGNTRGNGTVQFNNVVNGHEYFAQKAGSNTYLELKRSAKTTSETAGAMAPSDFSEGVSDLFGSVTYTI